MKDEMQKKKESELEKSNINNSEENISSDKINDETNEQSNDISIDKNGT